MTMVEFLRARLDERERAARAAIREHEKAVREFLAFRLTLADRPDDSLAVADPDEQPGRWSGGTNEDGDGHFMCGVWAADGIKLVATMHDEGDLGTAEHIALHDPAHVLAEVAAKRAILELHHETTVWIDSETSHGERCKEPDYVCAECEDEFPCKTLRLLASMYPERKPDRAADDR